MKRLGVFLIVISNYCYGQQTMIDSIRSEYSSANPQELAEVLRREGIRYKNQGLYKDAEELYLESLRIYQEESDSIGVSNVYNNLALIYSRLGKNQEALEKYYKAIEINKAISNSPGLMKNYLNLGNFFLYLVRFNYFVFFLATTWFLCVCLSILCCNYVLTTSV